MAGYFITSSNFEKFVDRLISNNVVYAPIIIENRPRLRKIDASDIPSIDLHSYRTSEPIKSLFLKARENVSSYFGDTKDVDASAGKNVVFCKSCDIAALVFEDKFFSDEINDPFYTQVRDNTVIIGSDCGDAISTCHCNLVNVKPYAEKDFDLNMSKIEDGYLVDVGSDKGQELIDGSRAFFIAATPSQREKQSRDREAILNKVTGINEKYKYHARLEESVKKDLESEAWRSITKACTDCGACNMACPTCTCFLLYDEKGEGGYVRGKQWDSCMKAGYARVAGGGNVRPQLYRRTQNRWQCKFDYMFDKYNMYACSGCGRCTETCMAKIDLRDVFLELEKQAALGVKLE